MRYWLDLFTPETWQRFQAHGSKVSGFPPTLATSAKEVEPGDLFVCYLVRVSRFCGVLRVESEIYTDRLPIFTDVHDSYPVRFRVSGYMVLT